MTWEDLKTYTKSNDADDAYVMACFEEATGLVEAFVGSQNVPASAKDRAILECGSELFHRRNAPNGIAQFASYDSAPIRVARDPMVGAYPILARYMVVGF